MVTAPFTHGSLWTHSCNFRGMSFALYLCNTKAKLAIKQNSNKDVENGGAYEEKYMD